MTPKNVKPDSYKGDGDGLGVPQSAELHRGRCLNVKDGKMLPFCLRLCCGQILGREEDMASLFKATKYKCFVTKITYTGLWDQ